MSLFAPADHLPSSMNRPSDPRTLRDIRSAKGQRPLVALTAYDAITATLADRAEVDILLVGDSLGTTLLGFETTVPVTLEMILHHTAAVTRNRPRSLVVSDIPFGYALKRGDQCLEAAIACLQKGGAQAVKIEGGEKVAPLLQQLTDAGIPVLGHIGLQPQQVHQLGGYRKFGRSESERKQLIQDAQAVEAAGAFALVAEMVESETMRQITEKVTIPTIGIGSGPHCDGQILVSTDLLGLTLGKTPAFAKAYDQLADRITQAFQAYADDVRNHRFPTP